MAAKEFEETGLKIAGDFIELKPVSKRAAKWSARGPLRPTTMVISKQFVSPRMASKRRVKQYRK
jgi:hypothetical protein